MNMVFAFQEGSLFFGTSFPNIVTDIPMVCDKMVKHATGGDDRKISSEAARPPASDSVSSVPGFSDLWPVMKKDLLWTEARDVWNINLDPLWADFHGTPVTGSRPVPFVDAFPVCLWLYKQEENDCNAKKAAPPKLPERQSKRAKKKSVEQPQGPILDHAKMHLLVHVSNLVSVQLNHFQFLFLMRLLETVSEITTFLTQDVSHILGKDLQPRLSALELTSVLFHRRGRREFHGVGLDRASDRPLIADAIHQPVEGQHRRRLQP